MTFSIAKIAYGPGAEIRAIDATKALEADVVSELRVAWLENLLRVFRAYAITPEQHIAFSRNCGTRAVPPNRYAVHIYSFNHKEESCRVYACTLAPMVNSRCTMR